MTARRAQRFDRTNWIQPLALSPIASPVSCWHDQRMVPRRLCAFLASMTIAFVARLPTSMGAAVEKVTGESAEHYRPFVGPDGKLRAVQPGPRFRTLGDGQKYTAEVVHGLSYQGPATPLGLLPSADNTLAMVQPEAAPPSAAGAGVQLLRGCGGRWQWFSDGQPILMRQGGAYSPVEDGRHINDYIQNHQLDRLVAQLLPAAEAAKIHPSLIGRDHGKLIHANGFTSIRLYQAPLDDEGEIARFKQVMRRAFELYGIRVNLGDFLGLYDSAHNSDKAWIEARVRRIGQLYGSEPWVAAISLGNESDMYLPGRNSFLSLKFQESEYYALMDNLAKILKLDLKVQRPILIGHGRPETSALGYLARLDHFDGVGFNLYGDTQVLTQDLVMLQNLNRIRSRATRARRNEFAFVLNEFGQDRNWILTLTDAARAAVFAQQMDVLDASPLVASRYAFALTDEKWKAIDEGPGADQFGILGKPPLEKAFLDHRETPPPANCPPPPREPDDGPIPRTPPPGRSR